MEGGRGAAHPMNERRGQKRSSNADSCGSTTGQERVTKQDVLGAKVYAVLCAVRAGEQRERARKRQREQEANAAESGAHIRRTPRTAHPMGWTLHAACGGEEEKQRRPKTPRIEPPREVAYYREYPEREIPAVEEGIWDGRPKRGRMAEGKYDQVKRRGPRQTIKKETRRQKVSIVPVGRRVLGSE